MEARVGVSVIIFNQLGEVLVGKRQGSHGAGMLSAPGGHLEFFETSDETCDRELLEEIGVNFEGQYKPIGFSEDFFDGETRKHYITLYFVVTGVDSDKLEIVNMEPDKCESWDWVAIEDLPDNMFCDTYNKITEYAKVNYPITNMFKVSHPQEVTDAIEYCQRCESDLGFMGSPKYYEQKDIIDNYNKKTKEW